MMKSILQSWIAAVLITASALAADDGAAGQQQQAAPQPALAPQKVPVDIRQGRIFASAVPRGWNWSENICGVDMRAPDGLTGVSRTVFHGFRGQTSPDMMIQYILTHQGMFEISDAKILVSRKLGDQSKSFVLGYVYRGHPLRGLMVCTAYNMPFGGFVTDTLSFQTTPQHFDALAD